MDIVKITDGLGNQMFQYAFALSLQICNSKKVYLDNRFINNEDLSIRNEYKFSSKKNGKRVYGLDKFNISVPIADGNTLNHWDYLLGKKSINTLFYKYVDEDIKGIDNTVLMPTYYKGYFFDLNYFNDIKHILQKEFTLKQKMILPQDIKYTLKNDNTVSIHIRRGDFLKLNRDISQKDYYPKALKIIREMVDNPTFLIFSDDIEWVKSNLQTSNDVIYVSDMGFEDYEELTIMKHCKHNIIANSTFSYWAAYLNANRDKKVICPKHWKTNIIPKEWITV